MHRFSTRLLGLIVLFSLNAAVIADVVDIRDEPGGKRLFVVDGDDIRDEPGGKRLLFIDGDTLRHEPGGDRLIFIDGDDIRPEPGGIRLLFIDGQDIRRRPGSDRMLFIDGQDVRDQPGGKRLFFIDGELTHAQRMAVLYIKMPELFKLSPAEEAELKAAMAAAAAESDREMNEALYGTLGVINSNIGDFGDGAVTTTAGKDGFVYFDCAFKGAKMLGIGVTTKISGDTAVLFAAAPEGAAALAVYEVTDGVLNGKWVPINAAQAGKDVLGVEVLKGAAEIGGEYKITEAKAPNGGAAYSGTLKIAKIEPEDAHQVAFGNNVYTMNWDVGGTKIAGFGFLIKTNTDGNEKKFLVATTGAKEPIVIGTLLKESASSVKGFELVTNRGKAGYVNVSKK